MDYVTKDLRCGYNVGINIYCRIMHAVSLSSLAPGETATIVTIHSDGSLHQRLLAMGFRNGKTIGVIRQARFSGPLQVRIGTTDILLRVNEADKIMVKRA